MKRICEVDWVNVFLGMMSVLAVISVVLAIILIGMSVGQALFPPTSCPSTRGDAPLVFVITDAGAGDVEQCVYEALLYTQEAD